MLFVVGCVGVLFFRPELGLTWLWRREMIWSAAYVKWRFWCDIAYFYAGLIQDLAFNNRKLDFHVKQSCMWGEARWLRCNSGHCFCFWATHLRLGIGLQPQRSRSDCFQMRGEGWVFLRASPTYLPKWKKDLTVLEYPICETQGVCWVPWSQITASRN